MGHNDPSYSGLRYSMFAQLSRPIIYYPLFFQVTQIKLNNIYFVSQNHPRCKFKKYIKNSRHSFPEHILPNSPTGRQSRFHRQ